MEENEVVIETKIEEVLVVMRSEEITEIEIETPKEEKGEKDQGIASHLILR